MRNFFEAPPPEPQRPKRRDTPSDSQMGGTRDVTFGAGRNVVTPGADKESRDFKFARYLVANMAKRDPAVRLLSGVPPLFDELELATLALIENLRRTGVQYDDNDTADIVIPDLVDIARRMIKDPRNTQLIEASLG